MGRYNSFIQEENMIVKLNNNRELVEEIKQKLNENDGYCPCKLIKNEDTKCMCKEFKEQKEEGVCHCGLYMKVNKVKEERLNEV